MTVTMMLIMFLALLVMRFTDIQEVHLPIPTKQEKIIALVNMSLLRS